MKLSGRFNPVFFLYILCLPGCSEQNTSWSLTIENERLLDSIPSGSGIVIKNDTAYIIGDDATGVYKLNLADHGQQKIPVTGLAYNKYREPKSVKHDFESATLVNWNGTEYLLAFGSGSSTSSRDSMMMLNTSNYANNRIISIKKFYEKVQALTHTNGSQWNIEGAATVSDNLIILNRGNNLIVRCKVNAFLSHVLNNNAQFPEIEYHKIKLPSINKHEARLSGVCSFDNTHILFSASVEDTPDWTKDGPVLGSFLGIYSLSEDKVVATYLFRDKNKKPLKEKIESLDIWGKEANGNIILIAIGDNDTGTSNLFQLKLIKNGLTAN